MKRFTDNTTLTGIIIIIINPETAEFIIRCRSCDEFIVSVGRETQSDLTVLYDNEYLD